MKKLNVGKLGCGYVAGLLLVMSASVITAQVKLILEGFRASFARSAWHDTILFVSLALLYGIASWGVFRKQLWSYYLSLVICADLVVNSAYDFFALPLTGPRHWVPAILLVLSAVALALLVPPSLRSQFPRTFRKATVA